MLKRGKKSKAWDNARRKLKRIFENSDRTFCESCGSTFGLTFAHRLKRRFITTDAELLYVACLCLDCHNAVETLPHEQMYDRITAIREANPLTNWP